MGTVHHIQRANHPFSAPRHTFSNNFSKTIDIEMPRNAPRRATARDIIFADITDDALAPVMPEGSEMIFYRTRQLTTSGIHLVQLPDGAYLARTITRQGDLYYLRGTNPAAAELCYREGEIDIVGVAIKATDPLGQVWEFANAEEMLMRKAKVSGDV